IKYDEKQTILGKYKHDLLIRKNKEYYIAHEKISQLKRNSEEEIALIEKGELITNTFSDFFVNQLTNLLYKRSIVDISDEIFKKYEDNPNRKKLFEVNDYRMFSFINFSYSVEIRTEYFDNHGYYILNSS